MSDWERSFAAADRIRANDPRSFREPLERLVYAIDAMHVEDVYGFFAEACEALYPESGGVPPWRIEDDRNVAVPEVRAGDPGGDEGPALGVGDGDRGSRPVE